MDILYKKRRPYIRFALLASGSKGNCCPIKHKGIKLVIGCGATRKYLKSCFEQISHDPMQSNALLITHTHNDHIAQMKLFDPIPTYATQDTAISHLYVIRPCDRFELQDFRITVLSMSHDCEGTVGYVVETEDKKTVYAADTGYIKDEVKECIRNVDYYVFENNYDIEMLMQTTRSVYLKQRIIGNCGYLYNKDCPNTLCGVMGDHTKGIAFAHISQERDIRDMASTTLKETLKWKQKDREGLRLYPADQFSIYTEGESS